MNRYTIVIEAAERPGLPPVDVRLRQWLKIGLRGFGLRVTAITGGETEHTTTAPAPSSVSTDEAEQPRSEVL